MIRPARSILKNRESDPYTAMHYRLGAILELNNAGVAFAEGQRTGRELQFVMESFTITAKIVKVCAELEEHGNSLDVSSEMMGLHGRANALLGLLHRKLYNASHPKQTLRHTAAAAIQAIVPDLPSNAPFQAWFALARDAQEWARRIAAHKQPPPPSPFKHERARVPLHPFQKGALQAFPEHPNLRAAADATGYTPSPPPSPTQPPSASPIPTPPRALRRWTTIDETTRQRRADAQAADGDDVSPPLAWSDAPDGTESLVLIVDDPKAGGEPWTHWIVYNLPATLEGLDEGVLPAAESSSPDGFVQGVNSFGERKRDGALQGYMGPDPPTGDGPHVYYFRIFALNGTIDLDPAEATRGALDDAMDQLTLLGKGNLKGTYGRE